MPRKYEEIAALAPVPPPPSKPGYVYAIGPMAAQPVKIGYTRDTLTKRLCAVQTGHPVPLTVLATVYVERHLEYVEQAIHRLLKPHEMQGEWFDVPVDHARLEALVATAAPLAQATADAAALAQEQREARQHVREARAKRVVQIEAAKYAPPPPGTHGTRRAGRPRLYETRAEINAAYYLRKKQRRLYPPLPPGPYRVIYADPPWQYLKRDPAFSGRADNHYPTLSIAELCALPVRKLVAPKAVLFLWVTSPILPECFPVIKAWGFVYKTSLVWDKGKMIHGKYVGNQHEFLLVGTRGSCKSDSEELEASVRRIRPTAHSTKPPEFRLLIDHLYPEGPRLELFARTRVEGWGLDVAG